MAKTIAKKTSEIDMSGFKSSRTTEGVRTAGSPITGPGRVSDAIVGMGKTSKKLEDTQAELEDAKKKLAGLDAAMTEKEEVSKELAGANKKLSEFDGAAPVRLIDAKLVRRSKWANRHEESFADAEFGLLKADIESAGGNVQPIKVRPIAGESGNYEIVFGHRRHQACFDLGISVLALIEDVSEQELFVEMDRENRQRKDLRPYEQGLMYRRALDEGLFASARKLADFANVDITNLGKAVALARLPTQVLEAFSSPLDIQLRWATDLTQALQKDPDLVLANAKKIQNQSPRPAAKKVLEQLIEGGSSELPPAKEVVLITGKLGQSGSISINRKNKSVAVNLKNIDLSRFSEFQKLVQSFIS